MQNSDRSKRSNAAPVSGPAWFGPLKVVSLAVIGLVFVAIAYGAYITLKYWTGIGV